MITHLTRSFWSMPLGRSSGRSQSRGLRLARKFRRLGLFSVTALVVLSSTSPAAAATISVTNASCTTIPATTSITGTPGDVVDISFDMTGCRTAVVRKEIVNSSTDVVVTSSTGSVTVTGAGNSWLYDPGFGNTISRVQITLGSTNANVLNAVTIAEDAPGTLRTRWNVTVTGGTSSSSSEASSLPPVLQQFGKPASGTCNSVAPTSLNWSGVAGGGWSESWAQWVNNGNGGAVCTRTLSYDTSQSLWVVG